MEYDLGLNDIENLGVSRIGKYREGFHRMIKIIFANTNERDAFVKNSSKMKNAPATWAKVYKKEPTSSIRSRK